jgi:hypothetical protein
LAIRPVWVTKASRRPGRYCICFGNPRAAPPEIALVRTLDKLELCHALAAIITVATGEPERCQPRLAVRYAVAGWRGAGTRAGHRRLLITHGNCLAVPVSCGNVPLRADAREGR